MVKASASRFHRIQSHRCAAFEYLAFLEGQKEFHLFNRLKPWDHCAGVLLLQEAGGDGIKLADGAPYTPDTFKGGLLAGVNSVDLLRLRKFFLDPTHKIE
ncbi:MAG: inositol monophosphatase family protein [Alphaproteobacteria bacterium]